jgi:hypothetical protein
MVFTFFLLRSSWHIKNLFLYCLYENTWCFCRPHQKLFLNPRSDFTDFALRTSAVFRKPLVYSELGFQKPLHKATGRFQLAGYDSENTFSLINSLMKEFSFP